MFPESDTPAVKWQSRTPPSVTVPLPPNPTRLSSDVAVTLLLIVNGTVRGLPGLTGAVVVNVTLPSSADPDPKGVPKTLRLRFAPGCKVVLQSVAELVAANGPVKVQPLTAIATPPLLDSVAISEGLAVPCWTVPKFRGGETTADATGGTVPPPELPVSSTYEPVLLGGTTLHT
jgi:hypothetical protein